MKRRKWAVPAWTVLAAALMLAGCGADYPAEEQTGSTYYTKAAAAESTAQEAMTVTVKVSEVDGTTIRGCAGSLDTLAVKEDNGSTPSDKPADGMENEMKAAVSAGSSTFTESGLTVTFTLAEDAVITIEYQQGHGEGTAEDIAAGAVLEVTLNDEYQAVAVAVKKPETDSGADPTEESAEDTDGTAVGG